MALFATMRLMTLQSNKAELIMKKLIKYTTHVPNLSDHYIQNLKKSDIEFNKHNASDYLDFPYRTFYVLSKNEMKTIIDESYKLIKENDLDNTTLVYNKLLQSYVDYHIDFDINKILNEMTEKQINHNRETFLNQLRYYVDRRDIAAMEEIIKKMNSLKFSLSKNDMINVLFVYYVSGQQEKAKLFTNENGLDENSFVVLLPKAKSYASRGDVENSTILLKKISQIKLSTSKYYFTIYYLLVVAKTPKVQLTEIIKNMKKIAVKEPLLINYTIQKLNKFNCFEQSLDVLQDFIQFVNETAALYIFNLYNLPNCPKNVYKNVLKLLLNRIGITNTQINLFSCMEFEDALAFAKKEYNETNIENICKSLINKAIRDKSINSIEISIDFTLKNLRWNRINLILTHLVVPSLLETGMVSNSEEILNLFPSYEKHLLSAILMDYLIHGNFDKFNKLLLRYPKTKDFQFAGEFSYLSKIIVDNLSLTEIDLLGLEGRKYFSEKLISELIFRVSFHKMADLLKKDLEITEIWSLLEKWNYRLKTEDFDFLNRMVPEKIKIFKPFFTKLSAAKQI